MAPFTVKWGILATGWIAEMFTKDLLVDPSTRKVSDVQHQVVAVASSSSDDRAKKFIQDFKCPSETKAYGSYKELVEDPEIDVIYVATPHSHHYQNVMQCLEAGKNVLCEKAFTVNAAQARKLYQVAKEKNLFLMEAVWTRYFPLSIEIRERIKNNEIGEVYRVFADLSFGDDVENKYGSTHRMTNPDLAGGTLLDLGIYSLTWVFQTLYHTLPQEERKAPKVVAAMQPYPGTGADEQTAMILTFDKAPGGARKHAAQAIATSGIRVASNPDDNHTAGAPIRIQGTRGEIQVFAPAFRPTKYRVIGKVEGEAKPQMTEHVHDLPGHGMFYEADEVARCLRDGKKQSDTLSWEESTVIMETMDEVRKQGGLAYPKAIETLDYPAEIEDKRSK